MSHALDESNCRVHDAHQPDERREWLRIEDQLLFEYRLLDPPEVSPPPVCPPELDRRIETFMTKPTADLLSSASLSSAESPLVPWLLKIDWLLNLILKTLAASHPGAIVLPEVATLNISAGGIGFDTTRAIEVGNRLSLTLILPPFSTVRAEAVVVAVTPVRGDLPRWHVSTEFTTIGADDRERLIRHILHTQAERLRERRTSAG